jgi:Flp pilus assembly pilin Flp
MIDSILKAFWQEENGQDLVEYALLLSFISLTAIALLSGVGGSVKNMWITINSQLASSAS